MTTENFLQLEQKEQYLKNYLKREVPKLKLQASGAGATNLERELLNLFLIFSDFLTLNDAYIIEATETVSYSNSQKDYWQKRARALKAILEQNNINFDYINYLKDTEI